MKRGVVFGVCLVLAGVAFLHELLVLMEQLEDDVLT